jgi:hypothetical protein
MKKKNVKKSCNFEKSKLFDINMQYKLHRAIQLDTILSELFPFKH